MLTLWSALDSHEANLNSNVFLGWTNKVLHYFEEFQHPHHSDLLHDVVSTQSSGLPGPSSKQHLCIVLIFWLNMPLIRLTPRTRVEFCKLPSPHPSPTPQQAELVSRFGVVYLGYESNTKTKLKCLWSIMQKEHILHENIIYMNFLF